jgi:hypothetical protein
MLNRRGGGREGEREREREGGIETRAKTISYIKLQ